MRSLLFLFYFIFFSQGYQEGEYIGDNPKTEIHLAAAAGNIQRLNELIEKDPLSIDYAIPPQKKIENNDCPSCSYPFNLDDLTTPLHWAVKFEQLETVQFLVEKGANIHLQRRDGWTALHYSANNGNVKITKFLLQSGAKVDAVMLTEAKATPLHFAANKGHTEVVKILLESGASPNQKKQDGLTPLHDASMKGFLEIAQLLVQYGADPSILSEEEYSPFHRAVMENHFEMVQLFLEKGVDPNLKRGFDGRAIHDASYFGHDKVIKLLIDKGANLDVRTVDGITPLMTAIHAGNENTVHLLLDNCADASVSNYEGKMVYDGLQGRMKDLFSKRENRLEENEIENWNKSDVCFWISLKQKEKSLPRGFIPIFFKNQIDGQKLLQLTNPTLQEIGIDSLEYQNRLLKAIEKEKFPNLLDKTSKYLKKLKNIIL